MSRVGRQIGPIPVEHEQRLHHYRQVGALAQRCLEVPRRERIPVGMSKDEPLRGRLAHHGLPKGFRRLVAAGVHGRPIFDHALAMSRRAVWASWGNLLLGALRALDERHVQITLKAAAGEKTLEQFGWNGRLEPVAADYLMLVESNVGFNKVNADELSRLGYAADLAASGGPQTTVTLTQTNPAAGQLPCKPGPDYGSGRYADLIDCSVYSVLSVFATDFPGAYFCPAHRLDRLMFRAGAVVTDIRARRARMFPPYSSRTRGPAMRCQPCFRARRLGRDAKWRHGPAPVDPVPGRPAGGEAGRV